MDDEIQGATRLSRRRKQQRGMQHTTWLRERSNCFRLSQHGIFFLLFTLMITDSLLDDHFTFWNVGPRRCIFAQAAQTDEVFDNGDPFSSDLSCWELPLSEERNSKGEATYLNTNIDSSSWLPLTMFAVNNAEVSAGDNSLEQLYDMEVDPTSNNTTRETPILYSRAKPLDRCLGGWDMHVSMNLEQHSQIQGHPLAVLNFDKDYVVRISATKQLPFLYTLNGTSGSGENNANKVTDEMLSRASGLSIGNVFARVVLCNTEEIGMCTPFAPEDWTRSHNNGDILNEEGLTNHAPVHATSFYNLNEPIATTCQHQTSTSSDGISSLRGICKASYQIAIPLRIDQSVYDSQSKKLFVLGHFSTLVDPSAWPSSTKIGSGNGNATSIPDIRKIDMVNTLYEGGSTSRVVSFQVSSSVASNTVGYKVAAGVILGLLVLYEFSLLLSLLLNLDTKPIQLSQGPTLVALTMCCMVATGASYLHLPLSDNVCTVRDFFIILPLTIASNVMNAREWRICVLLQPVMKIGLSKVGGKACSHSDFYDSEEDDDTMDDEEEGGMGDAANRNKKPKKSKGKKRKSFAMYLDETLEWSTKIVLNVLTFLSNRQTIMQTCQYMFSCNKQGVAPRRNTRGGLRQQIPLSMLFWLVFVLSIPQVVLQICLLAIPSLRCTRVEVFDDYSTAGRYQCARSGFAVAFTYIGFGLFIASTSIMGLLAASTRDFPTLFNESQFVKRMGQRALVAVAVSVPLFILTNTPTVSPDVSAFLWMALTVFLSINPILLIVRPKLCIVWRQDTVVIGSHLQQGVNASAKPKRPTTPKKKQARGSTKTTTTTSSPKKSTAAADTCNFAQKKTDPKTGSRPQAAPLLAEEGVPAELPPRALIPKNPPVQRRKSEISSKQHSKKSLTLRDQIGRSSERSLGLDYLCLDDMGGESFSLHHRASVQSVSFMGYEDDATSEPPSPARRAQTVSSMGTDGSVPILYHQKTSAWLGEAEDTSAKAPAYPKFMDFVPGAGAAQPPSQRNASGPDSPTPHGRQGVAISDSTAGTEPTFVHPTSTPSRRVTAVTDYPKFTEFRSSSRERPNIDPVLEHPKESQRRFSAEDYLNTLEPPNAKAKRPTSLIDDMDNEKSRKHNNDASAGDLSVSNSRFQDSSAMIGSAPSPAGRNRKKPVVIHEGKPLPSRLLREMLRVKPILEGVLQSTMAGIQAPREELESLRTAGKRLGHVCDRLEFAEEEETEDEGEDNPDAAGGSAPPSITGLRLIRGKTLGWFAGGGIHKEKSRQNVNDEYQDNSRPRTHRRPSVANFAKTFFDESQWNTNTGNR